MMCSKKALVGLTQGFKPEALFYCTITNVWSRIQIDEFS